METENATPRQCWAIFCATGYDVRACDIGKVEASGIIRECRGGIEFPASAYPGAILKRKKSKT